MKLFSSISDNAKPKQPVEARPKKTVEVKPKKPKAQKNTEIKREKERWGYQEKMEVASDMLSVLDIAPQMHL